MTNGEAIKEIDYLINDGVVFENIVVSLPAKSIEALNMATKALEKQIPIVPVIDRKWTRCKCGRLANHYNYCPDCGQKFLKAGGQNDN